MNHCTLAAILFCSSTAKFPWVFSGMKGVVTVAFHKQTALKISVYSVLYFVVELQQ